MDYILDFGTIDSSTIIQQVVEASGLSIVLLQLELTGTSYLKKKSFLSTSLCLNLLFIFVFFSCICVCVVYRILCMFACMWTYGCAHMHLELMLDVSLDLSQYYLLQQGLLLNTGLADSSFSC